MAEIKTLSASLEDYLEAIFNLEESSSVARCRDIADELGVSKASVTGALRLLKNKGLANYKPYDYVTLTKIGRQKAAQVANRHRIIKSFFVDILGVDSDEAQIAACKAEHALGGEIIGQILKFSEFVNENSRNGYDLTSKFKNFCETYKYSN